MLSRVLLAAVLALGSVAAAFAQCPGGNCGGASFSSPRVQYYMQPQPQYQQRYYAAPQHHYQPRQQVYSGGPSWTYPGSVASHLQRDHGVNVAGMSHSQMVQLHNNLHNSQRGYSVRRPTQQRIFRRW